MTIIAKGALYHLVKRVPVRFHGVETRRQVWISLHTDSLEAARRKAPQVWQMHLSAWEARLDGDTTDAERRYEAARKLAAATGYRYIEAPEVAKLPLEELLQRMEKVHAKEKRDELLADALLGRVPKPPVTISRALEIYWEVDRDKLTKKSEDQIRRWKHPRRRAFTNFIDVVGDKPINEITADDVLNFRDWWIDRVETDGLQAASGNKDIGHIATILRVVNVRKRLGITFPFEGMRLAGEKRGTRPPLPTDWIREKLLAPGALGGLNTEARCILVGMVNTGYRPSEGAALTASRIRLTANVPHIEIAPEGRELKTNHSARIIPLAGVSLEAFRECAQGFPRYFDKPGLSDTVNKFLRENALVPPGGGQTMYSLRHSFEDRLLDADVDERIRRDLMGHALNRERYGKGASLEKLHEVVSRIAI